MFKLYKFLSFIYSGAEPKEDPDLYKYGPKGFFGDGSLSRDVPAHLNKLITETANHALARNTWSTYNTSMNMLSRCNQELGTTLGLPMSETDTTIFVGWLLDKGLSSATISSYLSGLRQKQISLGLGGDSLRSPLINQVITGRKNQENVGKITGQASDRIPVTPKVLLLIKKDLKLSTLGKQEKLLIWSACTLMFFGAFRGGELLAKKERTFDPVTVLLTEDIQLKTLMVNQQRVQLLQVKLKCEKTNRSGAATIVDVYASQSATCPVAAWKKLQSFQPSVPKLPAFMTDQNTAFTCNRFNRYLADFNKKYFNQPGKSLSAHCFRAGMATMLAKIGFTDSEIMCSGRWSSKAFQEYIKLPRTRRLEMAKTIARLDN